MTRVYAPPYGFTAPTPLMRSCASHLDRIQVKFISGEREQQLQLRQEAARLLPRRAEMESESMSAGLDIHNTGRRSEGRGRRSARPPISDLRSPTSDLWQTEPSAADWRYWLVAARLPASMGSSAPRPSKASTRVSRSLVSAMDTSGWRRATPA